MLDNNQQWVLFGFDVRKVGHYFRAGWHDFLWDVNSPVLAAVDEPVTLHTPSGETHCYRAGKRFEGSGAASCEAVQLPEELVLLRKLKVPLAAEPELDSVIALEVSTGSPFAEDDTSFGSLVLNKTEEYLELALAISSRSAVMAHIAQVHGSHDTQDFEVWAPVSSEADGSSQPQFVVLSGFAEPARQQRNLARMKRVAGMAAYCAIALVLIFGVAAGNKYLELQRIEAMQADIQARAADALRMREQLASSKELIAAAQALTDSLQPPLAEFKRLTQILDSDTWLKSADFRSGKIKIEGESDNATAVMQLLLDNPAYTNVESPVAFKKVRSGKERFVFSMARTTAGSAQ